MKGIINLYVICNVTIKLFYYGDHSTAGAIQKISDSIGVVATVSPKDTKGRKEVY